MIHDDSSPNPNAPQSPGSPPIIGFRRRSPAFEALRGRAKSWLNQHQPKIAKRVEGCPVVYFDAAAARVRFGTHLADRWLADIVAVAGIWIPNEMIFSITLHDDSCPPNLVERLQFAISRPPLDTLPEIALPHLETASEDDAWHLAALLADGSAAAAVQAVQSNAGFMFMLIEELQAVPAAERTITPESATRRLAMMAEAMFHSLRQAVEAGEQAAAPTADPAQLAYHPDPLGLIVSELTGLVNGLQACGAELAEHAASQANSASAYQAVIDAYMAAQREAESLLDLITQGLEAGDAEAVGAAVTDLSMMLGRLTPRAN